MAKRKKEGLEIEDELSEEEEVEALSETPVYNLISFMEENVQTRNYVTGQAFRRWVGDNQKIHFLTKKSMADWTILLETFLNEKT